MSKRGVCALIFAVLLAAEVCIGRFADPSGFVRGRIGDVLVIPLIYFLIRIFCDPFRKLLPFGVFLIGCAAEIFQAIDMPVLLGIREGSLLAVMTGTKADFGDILCYFAGTLVIYIYVYFELKGDDKNAGTD